jgi:hypothetical protein
VESVGDRRSTYRVLVKKSEGKKPLTKLSIAGKIILK